MKPTQKTDAELKAEFIAKHGVKRFDPPSVTLPPLPAEPEPRFRERKPRPMPPPAPEAERGKKPSLLWVSIADLHVNHEYQRTISTERGQTVIRQLVAGFRWNLFSPITITQRAEGGYWVIDGQHRMTAARIIGIEEIPATFILDLPVAEQALVFAGINAKRVSVSPLAIHHAMLAAGNPDSVALNELCTRAGVSIPRYTKAPNSGLKADEVLCIATLKTCMKEYGPEALEDVLRAIRAAYPTRVGMLSREQIKTRLERRLWAE